jgi:hypothetical protein
VRHRRIRSQVPAFTSNMPAWNRLPLSATMTVTTPLVGTGQTWKVTKRALGMGTTVQTAAPASQTKNCAKNC